MADDVVDGDKVPIKVGTRVRVYGFRPDDDDPKEYHGVVESISDLDGDVDDEGRSFAIPPKVTVKFDDESTDSYSTVYSGTAYDDGPWACEDLEVVREGSNE